MGSGCSSPISLHSVHPLLFAAVWSLIGETMVAQGFLDRPVCEGIVKQVSITNRCPICVTAHAMMEVAAERERRERREHEKAMEKNSNASGSNTGNGSLSLADDESSRAILEAEAIQYAKTIHRLTQEAAAPTFSNDSGDDDDSKSKSSTEISEAAPSSLDARAKAEVAIVVLLFEHMNRVVSVIMGETMSTAMFGVPEMVGAPMESQGFMAKMNKWVMGPMLKGYFRKDKTPSSGFTAKLFDSKGNTDYTLPENLQGAKEAGPGRSQALARWTVVVDAMEKEEPIASLVGDKGLAKIATVLEDLKAVCLSSRVATNHLAGYVKDVEDEKQRMALTVILLTTSVPILANKSPEWKQAQKVLGAETARLLVVWWSMKLSLEQAKGLE